MSRAASSSWFGAAEGDEEPKTTAELQKDDEPTCSVSVENVVRRTLPQQARCRQAQQQQLQCETQG
jgi:hypothetical protein